MWYTQLAGTAVAWQTPFASALKPVLQYKQKLNEERKTQFKGIVPVLATHVLAETSKPFKQLEQAVVEL